MRRGRTIRSHGAYEILAFLDTQKADACKHQACNEANDQTLDLSDLWWWRIANSRPVRNGERDYHF